MKYWPWNNFGVGGWNRIGRQALDLLGTDNHARHERFIGWIARTPSALALYEQDYQLAVAAFIGLEQLERQ